MNSKYRKLKRQIGFVNIIFIALAVFALVGIGGYIVVKKAKAPELVTPAPAQPATTTDKTAGWKTYRNEKYGFEFKLPATYIANGLNKDNNLWFSKYSSSDPNNPPTETFNFRIISNPGMSLELWIENNIFGGNPKVKDMLANKILKPISVAGLNGLSNISEDLSGLSGYVWLENLSSKDIFQFSLEPTSNTPIITELESELLTIVDTLKFFKPK